MPATITPVIDGKRNDYKDAYTCVRRYYVNGQIDPSQLPVYGTEYSSQSNWPSGYLVTDFQEDALLDSAGMPNTLNTTAYILEVIGSKSVQWAGVGRQGGVTQKLNTVQKSMRTSKIRVTAEEVGAHKATNRECGLTTSSGKEKYLGTAFATPLNTADYSGVGRSYPRPGDYVYDNAQSASYLDSDGNAQSRTATAGYSKKWPGQMFIQTGSNGDNPLRIKHIGQELTCRVYTCTYWVESDRNFRLNAPREMNEGLVTNWGPNSGNRFGPITRATPSASGVWRCLEQSIDHDRDNDGSFLLRVTRSFIRCPSVLSAKWNQHKFGTWTADWPPNP